MRKQLSFFLIACLVPAAVLSGQTVHFDTYFVDKTMRVDYFHVGNAQEETVTLDRVYEQGVWAGSRRNLIDPFDIGRYAFKVYDAASGDLIFSKGFDSYFAEYKTTQRALDGLKRTYHETALAPFPKAKVRFVVERRDKQNALRPVFSAEIDPGDIFVHRESPDSGIKVYEILKSGDPHTKVDVALIAEGYTAAEEAKWLRDLERFREIFFKLEPYKSRRDSFNFYGVFKPSDESGCDEPSHGSYKNTAVGATFDSLGSERYLLTEDNKSLHDIAARVPYDTLFIMVNHTRYGGGGIYNFFCTFTSDNQWHEYLFLHEFGHSFAGLADEYYTSSVAYNDFYPRGLEPLEANITAFLQPENLKWEKLVSPGTAVPTPWEKAEYDRLDNAYQKVRQEVNARIAALKKGGAPEAEVAKAEEESERLSLEHAKKMDAFLRKSQFWGKVGAFEGAGYSSEGLYRPALDCLMFSKGVKPFCAVCERAVNRVIDHYCR